MAKLILQPYLLCLILPTGILFWIVIKYRKSISTKIYRLLWLTIILFFSIILLSTQIVSSWIEDSLYIDPGINYSKPDVIVVLGGGYLVNTLEELDLLTTETMSRVLEGVMWWKKNKNAILIMCGAEQKEGRMLSHGAFLMKLQAEMAGVPSDKVFLDTLSINTWDHPKKIFDLSIINHNKVVGIVTSKWHMRRALWSFERYFEKIQPSPIESSMSMNHNYYYKFFPNLSSISLNTSMIHEWIGLSWYKIKDLIS